MSLLNKLFITRSKAQQNVKRDLFKFILEIPCLFIKLADDAEKILKYLNLYISECNIHTERKITRQSLSKKKKNDDCFFRKSEFFRR